MRGIELFSTCLICLVIATISAAIKLRFQDCGSTGAKVESIDVQPCETDPCVLHHGATYTSKITFTALENTKTATSKMDLLFSGMKLPFPLPPNACKSGISCPVTKGSRQHGYAKMKCSPIYPKIKMTGQFRILDDRGQNMVCIRVPLEIKD